MTTPDEVIRPEEHYYIVATSAPITERALVLKQGDTFAVFDHFGDIDSSVRNEEGLYHKGTRFLSGVTLQLANARPLLLSSTVRRDNVLMSVDLTNPDIYREGSVVLPRGTLHIYRSKFLWRDACYERIQIRNFALTEHHITLRLEFCSDFADIFEVRGQSRERRGTLLEPALTRDCITLSYRGLDGAVRRTEIRFTPAPQRITPQAAEYWLDLRAKAESGIVISIRCDDGGGSSAVIAYGDALEQADRAVRAFSQMRCGVSTSNEAFNAWLDRSGSDLDMMLTQTPHGVYPYAGVPWFSTPFGRDGIITALECLWMSPEIAKGVLCYLSATQATEVAPEQDAEPGKILHETRDGEMAALNEIPFRRYYGSVDATPLFVMLAGAYYERTADLKFIESIWPNIQLALSWIDEYGDIDGDGFVEYFRRTSKGLQQQGWKDSQDSVFHADGTLAEGPIALCEVQGYVYDAKMRAATLACALGRSEDCDRLRNEAARLKERFTKSFWCDEIGMYALALDGAKRQCRVRTSNAGHCLYTGIATLEHARWIAGALMKDDFFTGWGIRTVAEIERRYNPMSYHNGSVWPHDNALIAAGFARYHMNELTAQVLASLFEASRFFDLNRLPELFCGFDRRPGKGPTLYPVACTPQTWAAVAGFCLVQASIGLSIDATRRRLVFTRPVLPDGVEHLRIRNLAVGDASADIVLFRANNAVALTVERRDGKLDVNLIT
ncbi:MAG TPA: amylo-alpha-1,6-glucosidase [Bryobacteraceae bacterium]|nr:amylo-alpha-1,6-glucosidase [Bryobacteraceae bacterium]